MDFSGIISVIFVLLLPKPCSQIFIHKVAFPKKKNTEKDLYQLLRKYFHILPIKSSLSLIFVFPGFPALLGFPHLHAGSWPQLLFSCALPLPFLYREDCGLHFLKHYSHSLFSLSEWSLTTFYFKSIHICVTCQLVPFYYQLNS